MVRTQVQLTEEQVSRLRRLAAKRKVSVAECVRRGVDKELRSELAPDIDTLWERSLEVVGKYNSGIKDLAENHDKYLVEAYTK